MNDPKTTPIKPVQAVKSAPERDTREAPPPAEEMKADEEKLRKLVDKIGAKQAHKVIQKAELEASLKPFQAELIRMQQFLEKTKRRMIILFEGRDASGKGGTIRRVTRYMNEKHYRVVALGKPTDAQRTQWFFQRYVEQFPRGGEAVLFDRSWYNRAMVEPVFGFCTPEEYDNFMLGVTGFEKDIVRQGTILVKLYFSVTKEEQARRFERRLNSEAALQSGLVKVEELNHRLRDTLAAPARCQSRDGRSARVVTWPHRREHLVRQAGPPHRRTGPRNAAADRKCLRDDRAAAARRAELKSLRSSASCWGRRSPE